MAFSSSESGGNPVYSVVMTKRKSHERQASFRVRWLRRPIRSAGRRSPFDRCDLPPPPLVGGDPRDDRVDRHRLRVGVSVPHVRGRGVCDSHRLDGPDVDGPPQGPRLSEVRLLLSGQRAATKWTPTAQLKGRTIRSRPAPARCAATRHSA